MNFKIKQSFNEQEKSETVVKIMRSLPDWFYMEETIIKYQEEVKNLPFFIAYNDNNEAVGMMCLIEFTTDDIQSVEIKVIGVLPEYHNYKIGYALIKKAEEFAKTKCKTYLTVKTLSARSPDVFYQKTRAFYYKCGFVGLMDFIEVWGKENPCLVMIKPLD